MEEILNKITKKNKISRVILLIISLLLSAVVFNIFLLPLSIVTGGSGGIATITHYLYDIPPSLMIFIVSATCVFFSFLYMGKEKTVGSIIASVAYPILVQLTSPLGGTITNIDDKLLLIIFAGVLGGVANGLAYKTGYNNGGLSIIGQILYELKKIPITKTTFVLNALIIIIGSYFFGLTNTLYAIIYIYICNIVADKVLLGISNNKAFYIITDEEKKVKDYIIDSLGHDVTVFDVKGGFLESKRKVILTVIPSREYYKVTEGIKMLDKDVFFVVTDSYQVEGGK